MEDGHKSGLYRWQRQTKPKVQSRSHRVTSTDNIQDWIKKVEEATNKATDVAFGLASSGKQKGKATVQLTAGLVRDQEQAYSEAQDLLTQWVNEKVRFDDDDGYDDLEAWRRARANKYGKPDGNTGPSQNKNNNNDSEDFSVERLTQLALADDFEIDEAAIYERVKRNAVGDVDPYANLYDMEENEAVDTVLQNMLSKEVVKDTFKKDLGFDSDLSRPDPRTKMELRHKMVKENREKRQKEEERRKTEAQMRKEARLKAQQLIQKEQKDREMRARKEEMELKKDMMKIRKEMQEERTKKEEAMRREREEKEKMDRLAREELERQRAVEEREMLQSKRLENDRRKKEMIKLEMVNSKIAFRNRQCLHRHLTAWYDLVLSRRLLMGKIKAMSDWKLMLKVWGAWRSYVRGQRLEVETEIHERNVIDAERKKLIAERHYTHTMLRHCFIAWQLFVNESVERREMEKEQERTKSKMMSLLNAVAEGKMWKEDGEKEGAKKKNTAGGASARSVYSTDSQKVEQIFQQPGKKQAWAESDSVRSSRSETSIQQINPANQSRPYTAAGTKGRSPPTEAWQVNRRHLKLTKSQISKLGQEGEEDRGSQQQTHTDAEIRKRFGTQPWMNRQYAVNNFEHRYAAQQQALKEQQNQIKEQKRLIEELQYEQRQQALKQHLLLGPNAPPLPPPLEIEAPPPGNQIPREDEDIEEISLVDGNYDNTNNHSNTKASAKPFSQVKSGGQSQITNDGGETDRSNLTTSRSEQSTATNVTQATSSTVKTHNTKYLQVLKNMEDRAAQRAKLKAEREEKRRKQEDERVAELLKVEEEKQREIEAEKKAKAEAYRQKKRLEKQKEEERQRLLVHQEEMNKKANEHYTRSILKYRGLLPFKKLISLSKRNWARAVKHHDKDIMRQCLRGWKQFTEEEVSRKKAMADQMHQFLVIKHSFHRWRCYKYHMQFLERRAERHYCDNLKPKFFQAWVDWVAVEREESLHKMELAHTHYLRHLPERLKREEERQKRKLELRQKVAELIPDFVPHNSITVKDSEDLG